MKLLIQRVHQASVKLVETGETRSISQGLVVYVGFSNQKEIDYDKAITKAVYRILNMKIFSSGDRMDQSLQDIGGEILIISNFTLYGRAHKGSQIDRSQAANYKLAEQLYDQFVNQLKQSDTPVQTGDFGAMMQIDSQVDGPVNLIIELG